MKASTTLLLVIGSISFTQAVKVNQQSSAESAKEPVGQADVTFTSNIKIENDVVAEQHKAEKAWLEEHSTVTAAIAKKTLDK